MGIEWTVVSEWLSYFWLPVPGGYAKKEKTRLEEHAIIYVMKTEVMTVEKIIQKKCNVMHMSAIWWWRRMRNGHLVTLCTTLDGMVKKPITTVACKDITHAKVKAETLRMCSESKKKNATNCKTLASENRNIKRIKNLLKHMQKVKAQTLRE